MKCQRPIYMRDNGREAVKSGPGAGRKSPRPAGPSGQADNMTDLKHSLRDARNARDFSRAIVEALPEPMMVLDAKCRVLIGSRSFYDAFQLQRQGTEGKFFYELAHSQWNIPQLRESMARAL